MGVTKIGVLTSGGDGPGLNPCIRAVVRNALHYGLEVVGIKRGYMGMVYNDMIPLNVRSVGGIIARGGTFLGTSRCPEFMTKKGQVQAVRHLNEAGIDGLVIIGGDGSLHGAKVLHDIGIKVVGVPSTIDNDLHGTDIAIGVDTALNTALEAIDRIKDTASSHQRAFLVEIMGRNCGYLALIAGIVGGAEMICIPEVPFELEDVARTLNEAYLRGKAHCIISVAEGARYNATAIAEYLREHHEETGFEVRVTILGHVQRGGSPSAFDRLLATRLGAAAVDALHKGKSGVMVGLISNKIMATPIDEVVAQKRIPDLNLYRLAEIMAQ